MTKKNCDMCGNESLHLNDLTADFRQDLLAEVCDDCLHQTQELLDSCAKAQRIQKLGFIRRFMMKFKKDNN